MPFRGLLYVVDSAHCNNYVLVNQPQRKDTMSISPDYVHDLEGQVYDLKKDNDWLVKDNERLRDVLFAIERQLDVRGDPEKWHDDNAILIKIANLLKEAKI